MNRLLDEFLEHWHYLGIILSPYIFLFASIMPFKNSTQALTDVAQWIGHLSANRERGNRLVFLPHTDVSLPFFLPSFTAL